MEIIKTRKGGDKLVLNEEMYIVKKKKAGVQIRWVCSKSKHGCKGAVTTDDPMGNARNHSPHNHGRSGIDTELAKFPRQIESSGQRSTKQCSFNQSTTAYWYADAVRRGYHRYASPKFSKKRYPETEGKKSTYQTTNHPGYNTRASVDNDWWHTPSAVPHP